MKPRRLAASALALVFLAPGAASAAFRPRDPRRLEVVTVPAVAGIRFSVDGVSFASGADGIARVPLTTQGPHVLSTPLLQHPAPGVRARLIRWEDGAAVAHRTFRLPSERLRLRAGFAISALTSFVFVDPHGRRLPQNAVAAIELAARDAAPLVIRGDWSRWLPSRVAVVRAGRLRQVRARYAVERVIAAGSNVVNRGQQRFSPGGRVRISVLFFPLRIDVHDAFFGFSLGSWAAIEYPDGHEARRRLHDGRAAFALLPRGNYVVKIDSRGIGNKRDVVVSRDAVASIRIVSYYDGLAVVLLFVLSSIALFAIGRGRRLGRRRPRRFMRNQVGQS
jgi:hypothetical protein